MKEMFESMLLEFIIFAVVFGTAWTALEIYIGGKTK